MLSGAMLLPLLLLVLAPPAQDPPPARELSRRLTAEPRLAGTSGSFEAAEFVAGVLRAAGWTVELDERVVLLSFPKRIELRGFDGDELVFERTEAFDPRAEEPGDVPKYNSYGKSGAIEAAVIDVGHGLRADYERLKGEGVEVAGKIALARYGGSYRGVKAQLAEEFGCVGCLLFSDPEGDGAVKGEVWPDGPWKPGWAAQRGSIAPLSLCPGDPSTPGWPSPAPGEEGRRAQDTDERLAGIPCLPVGADEALALIAAAEDARLALVLENPRELFSIVNVTAKLEGEGEDFVVAGNHRDAWVRGAHDAGSGTVALMRAGQILGARAKAGWKPKNGILLGFWDAEEFGLIGSTEWGEAHATELRDHALAYLNADAVVSGLNFRASGTPGLLGSLQKALERVPLPLEFEQDSDDERGSLWDQWSARGEPRLRLPGSGSDYTVFLHHLGIPVLDIGFGGNSGGHYHTVFDDFEMMDRYLDPSWQGHETAALAVAEILAEIADGGRASFDDAEAARGMAAMARATGEQQDWLAAADAEQLARAFEHLERQIEEGPAPAPFYRSLELSQGLPGRPWYRNRLWAPGLETGYAAEMLPGLRLAANEGDEAFERELADLVDSVERLAQAWGATPDPKTGQ